MKYGYKTHEVVLVSNNGTRWSASFVLRLGTSLPEVVTADHRTFVHRLNSPPNVYHETKSVAAFCLTELK